MNNLTPLTPLTLWKEIIKHEGEIFTTTGRGKRPGVAFTYSISRSPGKGGRHYEGKQIPGFGNELWICTVGSVERKKSISRSTVDRALETALEKMKTEGCVKGPRELGVPGAGSYLYPVFMRISVIESGREKRED